MKTKHTPGPFTVESVTSEHMQDICLGYDVEGAGSPVLIGTAYDDEEQCPGYISPAEAEANARLFAAAPDLLVALQELLEHHDPTYTNTSEEASVQKARAAIQKVEGK